MEKKGYTTFAAHASRNKEAKQREKQNGVLKMLDVEIIAEATKGTVHHIAKSVAINTRTPSPPLPVNQYAIDKLIHTKLLFK